MLPRRSIRSRTFQPVLTAHQHHPESKLIFKHLLLAKLWGKFMHTFCTKSLVLLVFIFWGGYSVFAQDTSQKSSVFITTKDADFYVGGQPFRFAGTNAYYLPTYEKINPRFVDESLDAFQEAGITVIRMWGFYDGLPQYSADITLQPQAGVYNETDLRHLDNVIAKAKRRGIRVILALLNYWKELGGVPQYNKWAGNPDGDMAYFIDDPNTQRWYKEYINMLLNRTNSITGIKYKDEPGIFSWEIIGEARLPDGDPKRLRDWYQEMARYIKKIDPNHLVATGEEGFESNIPLKYSAKQYSNTYVLNSNLGTSYLLNTSIPEIDYGTAHWYPTLYGFKDHSYEQILRAQRAWLLDHITIAEEQGKPFLLGEYGYAGWGNPQQLMIYKELWKLAEREQMDGSLLWQFTVDSTKCFESGGNICWPGGRKDHLLYESFLKHITALNTP